MRILILHSVGRFETSPAFLKHHVLALSRYCPEHEYFYHDTTTNRIEDIVNLKVDAIILDVSFLWARWRQDGGFEQFKRRYDFIGGSDAIKIAFPQDEYDCNELLDEWMCEWGVDIVFSVIDRYWDVLYPRYSRIGEIRLAYTGYIDESMHWVRPSQWATRPIDIGYRARKLPPYFGRLGETKWRIGEIVERICRRSTSLVTDIAVGDGGTLNGNAWLEFINDSKFTLGANSGSSLLDPRGKIQKAVREFVNQNPRASFEEVEEACFAGLDGKYSFTAISPRVLEAGMLGSCQILVSGEYSGIIKPWEHYIPIAADASNFDEVLAAMQDEALTSRLLQNCREALLDEKRLHCRSHAQMVTALISERVRGDAQRRPCSSHQSQKRVAKEILILASHAPQNDPRLDWIANHGVIDDFVFHQLGISRIAGEVPTENGSADKGWIWTWPRVEQKPHLGILRRTLIDHVGSHAALELANLVAIDSLEYAEQCAVLGVEPQPRMHQMRWYVRYLLQITASLLTRAQTITGISAVIAVDLDTLLAGLFLKERWNVPLIYDAHEFWPEADVQQAPFEAIFWASLERRLVRHVDYAQTVSPGLAGHMAQLYGKSFTVVPNAEPLQSALQLQDKLSVKDGNCHFLFQGGFAPARGVDVLIGMWGQTDRRAILHLRGPDCDYKLEMMRLAEASKLLGNRIHFPPAVPECELVSAASAFDVGLVPYTPTGINYSNCCPNKLSQYMAAGLPILACRTNYVEDVLRKSNAGIVAEFVDARQVVMAVDKLTRDAKLRRDLSQHGRDFFQAEFNWGIVSRIFYARLRQAIGRSEERLSSNHEGDDLLPDVALQKEGVNVDSLLKRFGDFGLFYRAARAVWHVVPSEVRIDLYHRAKRIFR